MFVSVFCFVLNSILFVFVLHSNLLKKINISAYCVCK